MLIQGQIGPIVQTSSIGQGTPSPLRQGNMGDAIMSELHGRYYEAVYRRAIFSACSAAAVATVAVGTTASYTGFYLANPIGNPWNLVLLKASYALSVAAPTAGFLALECGYNSGSNVTVGGAITASSNFFGVGAAGTGLAGAGSATLPTAPIARHFLSNVSTQATTLFGGMGPNVVDLEGSIILPPGAFAAFATFATNTAAWWFGLTWEEVPA
jgi:hypothetical protein